MKRSSLFLALAGLAAVGCGDDETTAPASAPYAPPPASAVVESGAVPIRREVFLVPGAVPPPNPVDGSATPAEQNFVRVVRYRVDADPPKAAKAIAVLVPGFLGGAGSYDPLARALVRRSTEGEAFEAWAIDRRSNLLEDHHGLDVAEVRRAPELVNAYYFEEEPVEGKTFAGFVDHAVVPYMSEWGLATTIGDIAAVIGLVPAAERKSRVVLVGHSLGASLVEEYAAWDFGGKPGYEELAGLAIIDGMTGVEGAADPPVSAAEYEEGSTLGGFPSPGLTAIRASTRYIALPFLGLDVYPLAAAVSMRSDWDPAGVVADPYRDQMFGTLLSLGAVPKMTNRAALGLALDDATNGVSFAAVSCGEATGGAMEVYDGLLGGELVHPSDPDATYDWREYDATSPREHTSTADIARSWYEGPGLDFGEWYFPARLSLDVRAAGSLVMDAGDFPYDEHGLLAIHGASMDLPILGAVARLVGTTAALDPLKALVASVPIGAGRPLAGTPRSDPAAFEVVDLIAMTHIDPLSATDDPGTLAASWFDTLADFMRRNSPGGGTSVPVQE